MEELARIIKICTVLSIVSSITLLSCTRFGALVYGLITKKVRPENKKIKVVKVVSFVLTLMCFYIIAMYSNIRPYYYKDFVGTSIFFNTNRVEVSEPYDLVVPTIKEDVNILLGLVYPNGIVDFKVKENTGSKVIKGSVIIKRRQNRKGYIVLGNSEKDRNELAIANFLSLVSLTEFDKPCVYIIDKENNCAYIFYEFIDFVQDKEYKILYAEDDVKSETLEGVDCKVYTQCTFYKGTN